MSDPIEHPSWFAATAPDRPATIIGTDGPVQTYGELEDRSCRVGNLLRSKGIERGGHVAVLVENRLEFFEVCWGAMRTGMYVTPINWHLGAEEAAYIIEDCGADVLFASATVPDVMAKLAGLGDSEGRYAIGGAIDGFDDYEEALASQPTSRPTDECEGNWMFYSSGTTGRPKGIRPPSVGGPLGGSAGFSMLVKFLYGGGEDTVYLSPAPLYHAAPSGWTTTMHRLGGTAVVLERFDPLEVLAAIERHRVTHAQFVPTHLIRLLKLPAEDRARFDLSSLEVVVHAAAPCPPDVKRAAMEWLGPVLYEYYSGSEGVGFCAIGPEEWLEHPGSVGRSLMGPVHITGPDGLELPAGEEGQVWFEPPARFEYHGDPVKTAEAFNEQGWGTLGDIGKVDDDGYLYLTDRVSNMIISGGVNVYPREAEDVLIGHPAVADVVIIGIPHPDLGETPRAVVELAPGSTASDELGAQLIAHCRDGLASFKCPTSVVFLDELPRLPTGKLAKRLLPESVRA
ncbi:acyl-CoA synthetase [Aquihabitans sp. McL0605]|uniref:acyl-CoA synthetase n=1 Tax=Aquihabitans sp. McL0605 TaxID=3415671 RepID=UPI003CEC05BA